MKYIVIPLLLWFPVAVCAADFVGEVGIHFGGDTMVTVNNTDGSTDSLKAGEELSLSAGVTFAISDAMDFIMTFGIKKEVVFPDDGAISFTRYPLNLLLLARSGNWHYGGGLTVHMNPIYKVDTDTQKETVDFKNAPGALLDIRYTVFDGVFVAGRYTYIEYEVENDPAGTTFDGSSIGILVGVQL